MGVLDDAIREHLDLKRARGSDPADIERMEREALGPVRREPTIGSTRVGAAEEHLAEPRETGYPDDVNDFRDPGYHDSTAPHPHPHHGHAEPHHELADPSFERAHDEPFTAEPEQPKRRFLRRNRPTSLPDPPLRDPVFHEESLVEPHGMLEHDDHLIEQHDLLEHHEPLTDHGPFAHEPLEHHEPLGHDEPLAHHEPSGHDEPLAHHEPSGHDELLEHDEPMEQHDLPEHESASGTPPHLQFEHPPKRPRFSAEPPSLHPGDDDEPPTGTHEAAAAAGAAPAPPAPQREPDEVQKTTEFDVQKHIAETRFQPDPETRVHPAPEAPAEPDRSEPSAGDEAPDAEDVLEETPEFLQDTPEHDRLWFEQRPPRDFDFDG
jgi:hypothetical protein